jgi:MFS family permease
MALGICYTNEGMQGGLRRLNSEIQGKFAGGKPSIWNIITGKKFRKMMRVGILLCMLNQLCGLSAIIFYSTDIFKGLGGGIFLARLLTFIMGIVNLISSIISVCLLHWFGRKTLIVSGQVLLAVDLVLLGIFSGYVNVGVGAPAVFVILFFFFFSYSLAATLWLYVGEVLNDQVLSVSSVFNMATSVIITFLFPPVSNGVGIQNVFLFFAVMMVLGTIYCWIDLVETKDKEKEQILIEMKVIDSTIAPANPENDSLQEDISEDKGEGPEVIEGQPEEKTNNMSIGVELNATALLKEGEN